MSANSESASQADSQKFALGGSDFEDAKSHTYFCFLVNSLKKTKNKSNCTVLCILLQNYKFIKHC